MSVPLWYVLEYTSHVYYITLYSLESNSIIWTNLLVTVAGTLWEKRKYQRLLVLDPRLIVWNKIECYFFSYLHNIELHDGRRKEKDGKKNWGKTWKGSRKCGKQRGNNIQNQTINSNHTVTKKHKKIIYLTNNKGVINV